jgi:NAD-dependent DNA ligase
MEKTKLLNGALIPMYLIHSYLYYIAEDPIISDSEYDKICKDLLAAYDIQTHGHRHLIDEAALEAGTGFHIAEKSYPYIVKTTALQLLQESKNEPTRLGHNPPT